MPITSEDAELSQLQRAAEFMAGVRLMQAGGNRKLSGTNYLSPEQKQAIGQVVDNSARVAAIKESANVDLPVNYLAERFEEMCRRQGVAVDAKLRAAVVALLAAELWGNCKALGAPAEKLISVTVQQGAIGPELRKEFERFVDAPHVFIRAAVSHASDPRGFLLKVAGHVDALAQEPEFERFRDASYVFLRAAVHNPSDPRAFLRKAVETIDALAREPEFGRLRETPGLFRYAAVNYPSDPRAFLRSKNRSVG